MLGFINVIKPSGMTSNAVVQKVKKRFGIKKIGHFGTLDPMASGILPLAIGKATRLFEYSLEKTKGYIATFEFGYLTDTLDAEGIVTHSNGEMPTEDEIRAILPDLLGDQDQIPPNYSAKNVDGKRAYDLARAGVEFELKPKRITISKLELISKISSSKYVFNIECSSGTYIRSIARDLGDKLGTYATMTALNRTMAGNFVTTNAIELDELLKKDSLEGILLKPNEIFKTFGKIEITKDEYTKLKNGIKLFRAVEKDSFVYFNGSIVGIAKSNEKLLKLDTYLDD